MTPSSNSKLALVPKGSWDNKLLFQFPTSHHLKNNIDMFQLPTNISNVEKMEMWMRVDWTWTCGLIPTKLNGMDFPEIHVVWNEMSQSLLTSKRIFYNSIRIRIERISLTQIHVHILIQSLLGPNKWDEIVLEESFHVASCKMGTIGNRNQIVYINNKMDWVGSWVWDCHSVAATMEWRNCEWSSWKYFSEWEVRILCEIDETVYLTGPNLIYNQFE